MNRREFIALFGGALARPLTARAQQDRAMPVIGFLNSTNATVLARQVAAFHDGLKEIGFV